MKRTSQKITVLLALIALSLTLNCAPQPAKKEYKKGGKEYGKSGGAFFRHRWWNYYERGLSFAEGKFFEEALADMQNAIRQREKDQRMARTYGMHFIDYFPHRELGIIHYEIGNLEMAKKELEISLSYFPSAKAHFYLDRVRKALIEREAREVSPPRLALRFKTREIWTREDTLTVSGSAEDEAYVASVTVNRAPIFLEGSQKRMSFEKALSLSQGRHVIEVEAKNLFEKVTKDVLIVQVDREGPIITLDEVRFDERAPQAVVTIHGSIHDDAGVFGLTINNQIIPVKEGIDVPFTHKSLADKGPFDLMARDRLGNQTCVRVSVTPSSTGPLPSMLSCGESGTGVRLVQVPPGSKDTLSPRILLRGWTNEQAVFLEKVYVEGQVIDDGKIASLTINQTPILHRKGQTISFNHFVKLREGKNTIVIEAKDETGNKVAKEITIIRRIPKALQLAERLSLTVLPFEQKGEVSGVSLSFQDNLIDSLVNENRFRVVERDKLHLILEEQKLSRSKLIDKTTALRLGKLVAAQTIITGSIIESRTGIEIVSRMIDTETSEILASQDVYGEEKDLPALRSFAEGLAIKFHRDFPLVSGLIIKKKGDNIFTDLGQSVIKPHRRLIVYQEEPITHPTTQKVLGTDNEIVGRARVTQVMQEISRAKVVSGKAEGIKMIHKVITE